MSRRRLWGRTGRLLPRPAAELASVWQAAYMDAVARGYGARPSGELTYDPECAAMAAVCRDSGSRGSYPRCWGGRMRPVISERMRARFTAAHPLPELRHAADAHVRWHNAFEKWAGQQPCQWSASRLAALAVFQQCIRWECSPPSAARAVTYARLEARQHMGLMARGGTSIEDYLAVPEEQRAQWLLARRRDREWRNLVRWCKTLRRQMDLEMREAVRLNETEEEMMERVAGEYRRSYEEHVARMIGASSW